VSEIQNLTSAAKWRFMPTQSSSADIVSRGCTVTELDASIWFTGPPFGRGTTRLIPIFLRVRSTHYYFPANHQWLLNISATFTLETGPKALVALLSLKFWIINARDLARRILQPVPTAFDINPYYCSK